MQGLPSAPYKAPFLLRQERGLTRVLPCRSALGARPRGCFGVAGAPTLGLRGQLRVVWVLAAAPSVVPAVFTVPPATELASRAFRRTHNLAPIVHSWLRDWARRMARCDGWGKRVEESQWDQRRISTSGRTLRWPRALLWCALANLAWEIVKANLNPGVRDDWPWRLTVLDASTCAAVVALLAGIIVTRAQLSQTMQPVLGWSGVKGHSSELADSLRTVSLVNAGGGRAVVRSVAYRIQASPTRSDGTAIPSAWVSRTTVIAALGSLGLTGGDDYFLLHFGAGAAVPMTNVRKEGVELLALGPKALEELAALDIRIQVIDVLGDVYERDLQCIRPIPAPATRARTA